MSTRSMRRSLTRFLTPIVVVGALTGGVAAQASATDSATAASSTKAATQATAYVWCLCIVTQAGPGGVSADVPIRLYDPAGQFSERWFVARGNQEAMLQTALASITSGKRVNVKVTDTVEYSTLENIYLVR